MSMQRRTKIALALTGGLALAGIAAQPALAQAAGSAWGSSGVCAARCQDPADCATACGGDGYVDENGDGVCDNRGTGTRPARPCDSTRVGACNGAARSRGRGGR